jgi:ABC-type amino acid transport substrate-binding protein
MMRKMHHNTLKDRLVLLLILAWVWIPVVGLVHASDLPEIRSRGELRIAARPVSTLIYSPGNSEYPGFCYEIAEAFAEHLDVELRVEAVESFRSYWEVEQGGAPPSLLNKVDMYADILTVTPERQRLIHMTPFVENTEVLVGAADSSAETLADLRGSRVAVVEGMSFHAVLENALSRQDVPFVRVPAVLEEGRIRRVEPAGEDIGNTVRVLTLPPGTRTTLMFFPGQLSMGTIDYFILDSFSLFHQLHLSQMLRGQVRPIFPLSDRVGRLAFGSSPDSTALNRALDRWMSSFRRSEHYNRLVKRYIGLPYDRYRSFVEDFPE